jgi:hypothetical protein
LLDAAHQRLDFVVQLPVWAAADDGRSRLLPLLLPRGRSLLHEFEAPVHGLLERAPIRVCTGHRMHALQRLPAQRQVPLVDGEILESVGEQVAPVRGLGRLVIRDNLLEQHHRFTGLRFALRAADQRIDSEVRRRNAQDDQDHPDGQGDVDGRAGRQLHGA